MQNYSPSVPTPPGGDALMDDSTFRERLRRTTLALALCLGSAVLVLLGLVVFLLRSANWVDHSNQVINSAHDIEKRLVSMQTAFRGYRLSADESFLRDYSEGAAADGVLAGIGRLEILVRDNPAQAGAAARLRPAVSAWFGFVEAELLRVKGNRELIRDPEFLARGVPIFGEIRLRLDALVKEELSLHEARAARLRLVVGVVLAGFVLAVLLGIPALAIWLRRVLRELRETYQTSLKASRLREEELHVTLKSIGDAVVATDAEGRVVFLNPVAEQMMGWRQEEARGLPLTQVFEIFNEYTREPAENPVGRVLRENIVVGLANHTVLRSRQGREFPIEDSAAPIRGAGGAVNGVILVFHDVTEKHRSATQLKESESRLSFLNEMGEVTRRLEDADSIRRVSVGMLGRFLKTSRCAYATVEADTGEFRILEDYTDNCPSTVGDYELSLFGPRAEAKMLRGGTLVIRHVDGELSPHEGGNTFRNIGIQAIICCPLLKEGKLRAMMAVHQTSPRNWTEMEVRLVETVVERCWSLLERKRAETELTEATARAEQAAQAAADSAERFRLLGELGSLQVWTATREGALDYVNQECLSYFGVSDRGQILGSAWTQFVHPADLAKAMERWRHCLSTGERYHAEFRLRGGMDREYRWYLSRAAAMRGKNGQIVKWFGSNTAIHELKIAQASAERASRAKDEFLATLSHELRTPLTPVLMTAASLGGDERLPEEVREQLGMMERNIALEARLIDDLLDLTGISQGKLPLRSEICDVHALIRLAVEIVQRDADGKSLGIECEFQATRGGLQADPARFQQVIWNLLRNAVKFTPPQGRIRIRTEDEPRGSSGYWLRIEISDSGMGINPDALEEIFQPFEQGPAAGDHRFGGMGLGLSIARAIVTVHGGHIRAQSGGAGCGATFIVELPGCVELPVEAASERPAEGSAGPDLAGNFAEGNGENAGAPSAAPGASATAPAKPGLRLLLVEDHAATLEALRKLLVRAGHEVITAGSVGEALAAADQRDFDLLVSDLGLPDGTGVDLMRKLRDTYGMRGVALSGYGMEEDVLRCRQAGFAAHLVKPVRFADLQRVIESLD